MEWTTEQYESAFQQTMVWGNVAFYILLAWFVFLGIWWFLDKIAQQKYYEQLTEEDKKTISMFNSVGFFNYKRRIKKNEVQK